jgi:3',5'-cyclic-AMP phosphodiesterase
MRIVQLTDLHVGQEGEDTYGVDVRSNFRRILEKAKEYQPDLLVVSGDLCYRDGDAGIYRWIKAKLEKAGMPYFVMSGNHDDPRLLAEVFGLEAWLKDGELYFARRFNGRLILFMDTTTGLVSARQLAWLREQLQPAQEEVLVFMHHPPVYSGVPFMDENHALRNQEAVQEIFFAHPYNINVFTGHYHVEKVIRKRNMVVHITPSCFFQIGQRSKEFEVDHHRIALREIDWENGLMMNAVHYLEQA